MPSLSLPGIFLQDATTTADVVCLDGTLTDAPATGGRIGIYGGGRTRWVVGQTLTRKVTLSLDPVSDTQLAWLEAHKDALVILRDPTGRRVFGSYGAFVATPYLVLGWHAVTGLDLWQVTRYESV